ncbi:SDR family oxidoreductase [Paracoccus sulfuroxidans]|uniref:NAD(P)-dependent dehydrogenase (Short-subunit alcohol dehydrogenase family) n=1 Tax=Paracoccus sulfuroxidans TaxID=384678 RepID=A0A562NQA4_9RHOB|nr:SDR family oxidoreductase [Paracoccus sulfuroxidans]TWI34365.1 NAD(P)-dependent dehydrogenase (short-subunit alcohol dehydrogenase family) [Paracoccus sulfuroxidans]
MTALVTGAGKRLGKAIALYLAGRGHDVAIHYGSSAAEAEETAAEARALGVKAQTFHADLLDPAQVQALIPQIREEMGPLKVLVNNASIFEYDNIRTADLISWDRHIGSNLQAPFLLTQAFAAQAARATFDGTEHCAQGLIINMVDQRVLKPTPEFMTYSIAKAGLWWLTQTSAQALAPDVRVNAIGPGPTVQGVRQSDSHFANQRAATILQRGAGPADITAAVGYFLDATSVTGQLICVDGGQHLGWRTPDVLGVE